MARRLVRGIGVFLIVAVLLLAAGGATAYYLNTPSPQIPAGGTVFKVLRGENLSTIAERLELEGLIRSRRLLLLFSRLKGTETAFKNGYFRILPGDSMIDVHNLLVAGYQEQVKLTIPEGWSLRKIARYMEEKGIATSEDFLAAASSPTLLDQFGIPAENLEGYLFPIPTSSPGTIRPTAWWRRWWRTSSGGWRISPRRRCSGTGNAFTGGSSWLRSWSGNIEGLRRRL